MLGRIEDSLRLLELAVALEVERAASVHHDLRDRVVIKQRLERPETKDLVNHFADERLDIKRLRTGNLAGVDRRHACHEELVARSHHVS